MEGADSGPQSVASEGLPSSFDPDDPAHVRAVFAVLSDVERRVALAHVLEGPVRVSELVDRIHDMQERRPGDEPCRERVEYRVHETHVPEMREADLVAFDETGNRLVSTGRSEPLQPFVELANEYETVC